MAITTLKEKTAHLLRRFGLGASEAEINFYLGNSLEETVDKFLAFDQIDENFTIQPEQYLSAKGKVNPPGLEQWWGLRLLGTRRPLQEKMTLFWHNHFATSAEKVKAAGMMFGQNQIFRENCVGNFRDLLHNVSKDPAMIIWLDTFQDHIGKPNENFAREVMELFTLGIGNYTEQDIQQSARAYTGWAVQRVSQPTDPMPMYKFAYRPKFHDTGDKTFFGKTGDFTGDQILDMLCDMPRTADWITQKFLTFFVFDKPDSHSIAKFSQVFQKNNLEIKPLLREIMLSEEFYSPEAERKVFKNPCDVVIATARQLGIGEALNAQAKALGQGAPIRLGPVATVLKSMRDQGMYLFFPPDVAGWRLGQNWISTATLVKRMEWGEQLFGESATYKIAVEAYGLFSQDPSPDGVVNALCSIFDTNLPDAKKQVLVEGAKAKCGDKVTPENANVTAAAVARLMFASPEFQFN